MKYGVEVIRGSDEAYEFKFVVRGSSMRHVVYGRVWAYALDENGQVKTFSNEGDAWAHAAKLSRGG